MRIVELLTGLNLPINNEEAEVLSKFNEGATILKADLEPREQLLANALVNKDVLTRRKNDEGKVSYSKKIR